MTRRRWPRHAVHGRRAGAQGRPAAARRGGRRGDHADRGSATAELAAAVPALVLLLLAGLTGVSAVGAKLRCIDAAREVALAEARGDPGEATGRRIAPTGATVSIGADGDLILVVVRAQVRPLGRHVPGFSVGGEAVAAREPQTAGWAP